MHAIRGRAIRRFSTSLERPSSWLGVTTTRRERAIRLENDRHFRANGRLNILLKIRFGIEKEMNRQWPPERLVTT